VTLTAGVGGSLLSVGSAAGVALMGLARGSYTFGAHFRWTWAIALGYAASVGAHLLMNRSLFVGP
jgi:Na+/H+ antiporter NhaD/arsenite permease-like protein